MRRQLRAAPLALALALLAAPGPARATGAGDAAIATALRDAIAAGEWERVRPFFARPDDPALAYLRGRWHAMRGGAFDPASWAVDFAPYYTGPREAAGQLTVKARLAGGGGESRRFDVLLARRGSRWLVDGPLPYESQDAQIREVALEAALMGGRLAAEAALKLAVTGPDRHVYMQLAPGLTVAAVEADGALLNFTQVAEVVHFERPEASAATAVTLRYAGPAPVTPLGREAFVLGPDAGWYPRPLAPQGAPRFSLVARLSAGIEAFGPGPASRSPLAGGGSRLVFPAAVRPGLTLYAGSWSSAREGAVTAALAPGRDARPLLAEANRALGFYSGLLGPLVGDHLVLIEAASALRDASCGLLALPSALIERAGERELFLAHELAHRWVDRRPAEGAAGERGFLKEATASYMDLWCRAERRGEGAFRQGLRASRARALAAAASPFNQSIEAASPENPAWQAIAYDKGLLVLHALRREVGDAAFTGALKTLYGPSADGPLDRSRFRLAFERTSGKPLAGFFSQWLDRPGLPAVRPAGLRTARDRRGGYLLLGRLEQAGTPHRMTVPVAVVSDRGSQLYQVAVRGARTSFSLRIPGRPLRLVVDPFQESPLLPVAPVTLPAARHAHPLDGPGDDSVGAFLGRLTLGSPRSFR